MADQQTPAPAQTDPAAPGSSTSEHRLTMILTIASAVIAAAMPVLDQLGTAFPNSHAIHAAISIAALLAMVLGVNGYNSGRVDLKKTLAQAAAATAVADTKATAAVAMTKPLAATAPGSPSPQ